jgi:hypothetical protein
MRNRTLPQNARCEISDEPTIQDIAKSWGLTANDWRTDLPEVTFGDEPMTAPSSDPEEEKFLEPAEIIAALRKIGRNIPAAELHSCLCILELQTALDLVNGSQDNKHVTWRLRGMPMPAPNAAESGERLELLLLEAFNLATALPTLCEGHKGYDPAVLGQVEASLERLSALPQTLKEAAPGAPTKSNKAEEKTLNH